jgi:hypothetical protein
MGRYEIRMSRRPGGAPAVAEEVLKFQFAAIKLVAELFGITSA